jgi:hypothetical protein
MFSLDIGHSRDCNTSAFSPDARRLALAGGERTPEGEIRGYVFLYEASAFDQPPDP